MLTYLLNIFTYYFSVNYSDNVLILIPGLGIKPDDYNQIIPKSMPIIKLDIWTDEELQYILENVGKPGTLSYAVWYDRIKNQTINEIRHELGKYSGVKNLFFVSHSIGCYLAFDIANTYSFEPNVFVFAYGGSYPQKKGNFDYRILLGTNDKIAGKYYENPYCNENVISIIGANHFSCTTERGRNRALKWRYKIGILDVKEEDDENKSAMINIVSSYLNFYINIYPLSINQNQNKEKICRFS